MGFGTVPASGIDLVHRIQQRVQRLLRLERLPYFPYGCIGIRTVEANRGDLLGDDPILDPGAMDAGIAFEFMKEQIDFIGEDSGEVVDVRFPVPIECGGKDDPGIVVENYEPQVVNRSDAVRVLLAFARESIGQQLAHAFRTSWVEFADKCEFIRLSRLCSWPGLDCLSGRHCFLLYHSDLPTISMPAVRA